MPTRTFVNPSARGYTSPNPVTREPLEFHRRLPGYEETPLVDTPSLAKALGVAEVLVKDESGRLGLPSFKILGASWATFRAVLQRLGKDPGEWATISELADRLDELRPMTLSAATD